MRSLLPLIIILSLSPVAISAEFSSPRLPVLTSWIGNTYPGAKQWVQQDIRAMAVMPDGTLFTNVEWEEGGGNCGEYRAGQLIRYAMHTHGWGNMGGEAVAANSRYLFIGGQMDNEGGNLVDPATWPPKGFRWYGVSRRPRADISKPAPFPSGKGGKGDTLKSSFLVVAELPQSARGHLPGLAADDSRLFVADPHASQIKVFDAESMAPLASWKIDRAGPLALDPAGLLWMLQRPTPSSPAALVRFTTSGAQQGPPLALPPSTRPVAFCFAPDGRLLLADDSPAQLVRIYQVNPDTLTETATFGHPGGILAGVPGAFANQKLNHITALGCDAAGNLCLAHDGQSGGGGTVLESYRLADASLNWRLFGLTFVDLADLDPADPSHAFTKEEHFRLDYAQPPGREWSYAGYTINPVKYPQDPRLHLWSAGAWVRRIANHRFLFVNDMNAEHLQLYRFSPETDGEIAIPAGFFAKKRLNAKTPWPPHQPAQGQWLWRDSNGNGAFDPDEYQSAPANAPASQGWWVDSAGHVWLATETAGLLRYPCLGLDNHGNPRYDFASPQRFPHPDGFQALKRLRYDPASDTLYLGGTSPEHKNQHWKPMGPLLARYDHFLSGKPQLRWRTLLPYATGSRGHESCEPMGFDLAGNYLFIPYTGASKTHNIKTGHVEILRASDAAPVGHVEPSADVGEIGLQDIRECLSAHRHPSGQYLLLLEDDYKSKTLLYRLTLPE